MHQTSSRRTSLHHRSRPRLQITPKMMSILIGATICVFIASILAVSFIVKDLPEPGKVAVIEGSATEFLDRDGEVIFQTYKDKNRIPVKIAKVSNYLKQATVSVEDKDFYKHQGYSIRGMLRGFLSGIFKGRFTGGSTLTQQLIKNVLLTSERTVTRKIKEFILSSEIERRYTKEEILEMYLNEAPYGGSFWGVASASRGYFGKDVSELNLVESAILAGLPQRPSYYSPFISTDKTAYAGRAKVVLRRMREDGYITRDQESKASSQLLKIKFNTERQSMIAPHFVFYVRKQLVTEFGEKIMDSGLKIKTTLSLDVQKQAEKIVREEVAKIKNLNATNGALVVLDSKTGAILAMVGSHDYNNLEYGAFNVATAPRQPGSALKPILYATALEKGYTASSVIMDTETVFPNQGDSEYKPVNYDGKFRGPVQLRFALANSFNIPAVKLTAIIGVRSIMQKAYDMGLTGFEPTTDNMRKYGLSIALGGAETKLIDLTSAYSVFARGGDFIEPTAIIEVKDHKGKRIFKSEDNIKKGVVSKEISFIISHILSDNIARSQAFGTRSFLNIPGKTVAVKTGTTNNKRDNLAVGYTQDVTVGVWVGNNDNTPMNAKIASGVTGASPIWQRMMIELLKKHDDGFLSKPKDVEAMQVDARFGGLPKDGESIRSEYFIKGTEPKAVSLYYKKVKLSKSDASKLANDLEVKSGDYTEKDYYVITEADPISKDGKNRWQEGIDAWGAQQGDERFKPPKETSGNKSDEVILSIRSPNNNDRVDTNDVQVKIRVTSIDDLSKVEIMVDGQIIKTISGNNKEVEETIHVSDGIHEISSTAVNNKGKAGASTVRIGVKVDPNMSPTPQAPTSTPTP